MRIPPYWICERRLVHGKYVRKYYISDISLEDASLSRTPATRHVESKESYHTPIYEPVLAVSDAGNVVTRQFILQVGKVGNTVLLGNSLNDYAIVF